MVNRLNKDLEKFLTNAYLQFNRSQYLESDPILFLHRYEAPEDQEVVGLLAALLAYGNVKQIKRSVEEALRLIHLKHKKPSDFIRSLEKKAGQKAARELFKDFYHRFNKGEDLVLLFELLFRSWTQFRSLGAHFMTYHLPENESIELGLIGLIADWKNWAGAKGKSSGFQYLLTSPSQGSCCKRWCMFLRWMGRRDEVDPGLWTEGGALSHTFPNNRFIRPDQLVMPLDTHTGKLSRYFSLTRRKSTDWRAALEVTNALKKLNVNDPISYDFAMSRLGILDIL
jgi:uncharacterized protein (TIGR02757 family)